MEIRNDVERLGISVDEAREILGIGKNLMLELVKLDGFPAVRFKRKIIINKELIRIDLRLYISWVYSFLFYEMERIYI